MHHAYIRIMNGGDKCPHCETGIMQPHGPLCAPGFSRKTWPECDACGYYRGSEFEKCTDSTCEYHGKSQ